MIHNRKNIMVSFVKHLELLKINEFYTYTLGKSKLETIRNSTLYILEMLYTGCSTKKSNMAVSFAEHLKFQEKMTSTHSFRLKRGKT